jgi:hypothetical protein
MNTRRHHGNQGAAATSAATHAYRLAVLSRAAAAALAGYAAAAALAIMLSRVLPMPRAEAVLTGMLLSFVFYAAAVLWAFAARSLRLVWLVLLGIAASCAAASWLLGAGAVF